ncbi:S8 family peptidase [Nonomuraea sp. CA-143628]|uniref:S8 family peptidase n=1 Tax=Nonomuraea sp. CA-143628 TaxID=3239997 RepID=UPI003D8D0217
MLLALAPAVAFQPARATDGDVIGATHPSSANYIVTLKEGAEIPAYISPNHIYHHAVNGFSATLTPEEVALLRGHPDVIAIEADKPIKLDPAPSTEAELPWYQQFSPPWNLDRIDQRFGLNNRYIFRYTGASVRAYVIDTGIQTDQGEFGDRAINVFDAFGGDGVDCQGHGTHVSGTVGSESWGVAKLVRLRGVKVFPECSGDTSTSAIIAGIDWVTAHAIHPAVANLSLGGPQSVALNTAVTSLANSGVFVSVAAGNENVDACTRSPASAPNTLTVAASDISDTKAWFSNFGPCVDLYAPGVGIPSVPLAGIYPSVLSGTSMAAPTVAGVAALIKDRYGEMSSSVLNALIIQWATQFAINGNPLSTPNRLLFKP